MRAATSTPSWCCQSTSRARRAPQPLCMPPCAPSPLGRDPVILSLRLEDPAVPSAGRDSATPRSISCPYRVRYFTGLPPSAPAARPSFSPRRGRHSRRRGSRPAEPGSTRGEATQGEWTPEQSGRCASTTCRLFRHPRLAGRAFREHEARSEAKMHNIRSALACTAGKSNTLTITHQYYSTHLQISQEGRFGRPLLVRPACAPIQPSNGSIWSDDSFY